MKPVPTRPMRGGLVGPEGKAEVDRGLPPPPGAGQVRT